MNGEEKRRFVVACGGTGGHVFPGLAVANVLRTHGHEVEVWLSGRGIEQKTLACWKGPVYRTGMRPLRLRNLFSLFAALRGCRKRMRAFRPDALLATGSYSSLPPVLAARAAGVPVILHEANAVAGKAVDFLSHFAACTAISFAKTTVSHGETEWTGLPVRDELILQEPYEDLPAGRFVLFVTGGSQGSRRVNELVCQACELFEKDLPGRLHVIHQCREEDREEIRERYRAAGVSSRVQSFFPDIGRAFASADFVISRAGASTCFELALLGKPALLIPLPSAVRDHQHFNAQAIAAEGGADEAKESEMTGRSIMRYLANKMNAPDSLKRMSEGMRRFAVPDAAEKVARLLERTARRPHE